MAVAGGKQRKHPGSGARGRTPAVVALALFVAALALYLPSLRSDFVYDDVAQIVVDDYLHAPGHLGEVLSLRVMSRDVVDHNRPLMLLSLMLDALLWGRNPVGYHATSVVLHGLCVVLLFLIVRRLLNETAPRAQGDGAPAGDHGWRTAAAAAGAALLLAHPLATEAVACVTFREDLLATCLVLASLACGLRLARTERRSSRIALGAAGVFLCFLATLAKETGVAGPVALAGCSLLRRRRPGGRARELAVLAGAAMAAVALAFALRYALAPSASAVFHVAPTRLGGDLVGTVFVQLRIWAFQLQLFLVPRGLSAEYGMYSLRHLSPPVAVAVLLLATAALALVCRRDGTAWLGVLLCAGGLGPVANLVPIYNPLADRYAYLPLAGAGIVLGAVLGRTRSLAWRRSLMLVAAAWLALLGGAAWQRQAVWRSELALWSDATRKCPPSARAHNGLAWALFEAGRVAEAAGQWRFALTLAAGDYADAWAGLALALERLGASEAAESAYREAVKRQPRMARPEELRRVLFYRPEHITALAAVARRTGLWQEGEEPAAAAGP